MNKNYETMNNNMDDEQDEWYDCCYNNMDDEIAHEQEVWNYEQEQEEQW